MKRAIHATFLVLLGVAVAAAVDGAMHGGVWAADTPDISKLPFSAARQAGNTLYVSGQIGVTSDGQRVDGDIGAETRQVMHNLEASLTEHGYTWNDVVKVTVYLSDMKHYEGMNAAYREFFTGEFPARECVGGLQIAFGLNVEASCIAYKDR